MGDTTIKKIDSKSSPVGAMGQRYLASGTGVAMRAWELSASDAPKAARAREDETVGYVVRGRATLESEGQSVKLEPGDSWLVPRGARHTYHVHEDFFAIEATHPPARAHERDEA